MLLGVPFITQRLLGRSMAWEDTALMVNAVPAASEIQALSAHSTVLGPHSSCPTSVCATKK